MSRWGYLIDSFYAVTPHCLFSYGGNMKTIVCIRDSAARLYGTPFFVQAAAQAVRSLRDEVNSPDSSSDVCKHPSDFELYELGSFDEDSAVMVCHDQPVLIARAKDLKESV